MLATMGNFPGGSAYAMARDIAGGFLLVTERTFLRFLRPDFDQLHFELERLLKELRAEQPDQEDTLAVQNRNRRIQRINSCRMILRATRTKRKI
jgi:hypothetical protein